MRIKGADFFKAVDGEAAFVTTNSICQGEQVPLLWPLAYKGGHTITFCHTSFRCAVHQPVRDAPQREGPVRPRHMIWTASFRQAGSA
ncbi:MAG: DNA methyltransferase [Planctomycetota bacterium]